MIERLLHFCLVTPLSPQLGMRAALREISGEYREFSWFEYFNKGQNQKMRIDLLAQVREFNPTHVFAQIQTANLLPSSVLEKIKCPILSWCGDLRADCPDWAWKVAPYCINCFSNDRDVENMLKRGYRAAFLNIGFSTNVFCPDGPKREGTPEIIFLGSNYPRRFPCSDKRARIVAAVRDRYGARFAVHGNGWGNNDSFLSEPEEAAAYRTCKIALDLNHFDSVSRFTSDRRFRSMGSGAFTLANWHPGIEQDFESGKHLVIWKTPEEIIPFIDYFLDHEEERKKIAVAGCAHVHANHSWDCRAKEIPGIFEKYAPVPVAVPA